MTRRFPRATGLVALTAFTLSGCASNPQLAESMQTLQSSMQPAMHPISNQVEI